MTPAPLMRNPTPKQFRTGLRKARAAGVTDAQIMRACGVSMGTVSRWFSGVSTPIPLVRRYALEEIAKVPK